MVSRESTESTKSAPKRWLFAWCSHRKQIGQKLTSSLVFFYYLYNPIIYNAKVTCIWIPRYLQNLSGVPKQSSCWSPLLYISQCQGVFTIPFIFSILEYFTDAEKKIVIKILSCLQSFSRCVKGSPAIGDTLLAPVMPRERAGKYSYNISTPIRLTKPKYQKQYRR